MQTFKVKHDIIMCVGTPPNQPLMNAYVEKLVAIREKNVN